MQALLKTVEEIPPKGNDYRLMNAYDAVLKKITNKSTATDEGRLDGTVDELRAIIAKADAAIPFLLDRDTRAIPSFAIRDLANGFRAFQELERRTAERIAELENDVRLLEEANERLLDPEVRALSARSTEPVAYAWRSLSDGSIGDRIAPTGFVMFEKKMEELRNDPWVKNGAAEIVPLYLRSENAGSPWACPHKQCFYPATCRDSGYCCDNNVGAASLPSAERATSDLREQFLRWVENATHLSEDDRALCRVFAASVPSSGAVSSGEMVSIYRAELRAIYERLKECQDRLQAGGERHSWLDPYIDIARERSSAPSANAVTFDLIAHLHRQRAFSKRTFGPGTRAKGVIAHIRKELLEIERNPVDVFEWIDVVLLALDGAWRAGYQPADIAAALQAKQSKNEARDWPEWRTASEDGPIEHNRTASDRDSRP